MTRAILLIALLSACAAQPSAERVTLGAGDLADAGTTAIALQMGAAEVNPLVAWAGDAAPLVGLALKFGGKHLLVELGAPVAEVNRAVDGLGWGAACANVMTISGVSLPTALVVGVICNRVYVGEVK